jgi:very-short-patch-repair endonuclease
LRREGWTVVRIWQHEISRDLNACVEKIVLAVRS